MSLLENLKLAWQNRSKISIVSGQVDLIRTAINNTPASGYGSTEFLTTIITSGLMLFNTFSPNHAIDPKFSAELAVGLSAAYGAYRLALKGFHQLAGVYHTALITSTPNPPVVQAPAQDVAVKG